MKTYKVTVNENGTTMWYNEDNKLHREDGPAIEYTDGSKYWYINNKLHREDGPASEYANGYKHWFVNGKRHREDGPAVEYLDGSKYWYINDKQLTKEEFNNRNKPCIGKKVLIDSVNFKIKEK
jgi:hypothetical protein